MPTFNQNSSAGTLRGILSACPTDNADTIRYLQPWIPDMQPKDLESVTAAEPSEHIDARERQPYQAPSLVRLEFKNTEAAITGGADAGIFS
jgi:hypothetical protein